MSIVRFAMLCDKCGRRSEEYGGWSSCRNCGEDVCPDCDVVAERTEDEANKTLCRDCKALRDEEDERKPKPDPRDTDAAYEESVDDQMGCL
jgi:NMD protein affecting ribosome stability and mRNA decay